MKVAIVLLVVLGVSFALQPSIPDEFRRFMVKFNKTYDSHQEFTKRLSIFLDAKMKIQRMNSNAASKGLSTKFGITKFADLTEEEFGQRYLGYKKTSQSEALPTGQIAVGALPSSLDWRTKGAVSPIKNQEQCGSCWAFSATEGVESAYFLAKKKMYELSPQQIVSCDQNDDGCDGGDLPTAFGYVQQSGLETGKSYPYTSGGGDTGPCNYDASLVVVHISGFSYATTTGNETAMQVAMITHGPLSVCVDASTWQYYTTGIITHGCGDSLDHCVQIVGWNVDTSRNIPYWIVRNSWGTDWGLNGYLWVERNKDECGISDEATYVNI